MIEEIEHLSQDDSVSTFRVYGDNILETELIPKWISECPDGLELEQKISPLDRPIYLFSENNDSNQYYVFQLCPGYDRWPSSPLQDHFSEKPDILVNKIKEDGSEGDTVLIIESCDAIPAGNQAWQRFRRAVDAAKAGVPYIYVAPLLDWEHDSGGFELKGPRYQSPQITLGQLTLSNYFGVPSLQVYDITSWCDYASEKDYPLPRDYEQFSGLEAGQKFIVSLFRHLSGNHGPSMTNYDKAIKLILSDMFKVSKRYVEFNNTNLPVYKNQPLVAGNPEESAEIVGDALSENRQVRDEHALHKISFEDLANNGVVFRKAAQSRTCTDRFYNKFLTKINWKNSETKDYKIDYLNTWDVSATKEDYTSNGLDELAQNTLTKIPVSYKSAPSEAAAIGSRKKFRALIEDVYPDINESVLDWITRDDRIEDPIFFVPLYGYKPSGDSRPDRGLLPLFYAMFPQIATEKNMFIIMYSKNTPDSWRTLLERGQNELWNVISEYGGAIIVDPTESGVVLE